MNRENELPIRKKIIEDLKLKLKTRAFIPSYQKLLGDLIESHTQAINMIEKGLYVGKVEIDLESKIAGLTHVEKNYDFSASIIEAFELVKISMISGGGIKFGD